MSVDTRVMEKVLDAMEHLSEVLLAEESQISNYPAYTLNLALDHIDEAGMAIQGSPNPNVLANLGDIRIAAKETEAAISRVQAAMAALKRIEEREGW